VSVIRAAFRAFCRQNHLPPPTFELEFHPERRWRFDIAWPKFKVALEVEGGVWTQGRHTRGSGFLKDVEKYNAATCLGWRLLRTTPGQLYTDDTAELLRDVLPQAA
jgi:hypothetical protein